MPLKIRALTMCKNEADLIRPWAYHHGFLFGFDNLLILDNGSTDVDALSVLDEVEALGVKVDRVTYAGPEHFLHKGAFIADIIKRMDVEDPADFYLPMDMDEFACLETKPGEVSFDIVKFHAYLSQNIKYRGRMLIGAAYDNHPSEALVFRRTDLQQKSFFAQDACVWIDHGFHSGTAIDDSLVFRTKIAYLHFHYRPYEKYRKFALQKLAPFMQARGIDDFDLFNRVQGPGFHLIPYLMDDEQSFLAKHSSVHHHPLRGVAEHFASIGAKVPFVP